MISRSLINMRISSIFDKSDKLIDELFTDSLNDQDKIQILGAAEINIPLSEDQITGGAADKYILS